jgi:hypothetical protein
MLDSIEALYGAEAHRRNISVQGLLIWVNCSCLGNLALPNCVVGSRQTSQAKRAKKIEGGPMFVRQPKRKDSHVRTIY